MSSTSFASTPSTSVTSVDRCLSTGSPNTRIVYGAAIGLRIVRGPRSVQTVPQYFDPQPAVSSRRRTVDLTLPDLSLRLDTDRGVFAADAIDPGTKLLLLKGPAPTGTTLLDLGCGYGPIALALARRAPDATVWAVDVNERALALCEANAAANGITNVRVGSPPDDVAFDEISSNPPIRIGKAALHELLTTWLTTGSPPPAPPISSSRSTSAATRARSGSPRTAGPWSAEGHARGIDFWTFRDERTQRPGHASASEPDGDGEPARSAGWGRAGPGDAMRQLDATGTKRLHREWRRRTEGHVALILDGVQTPVNVGSIVRAAAAFRVEYLWLAAGRRRPAIPRRPQDRPRQRAVPRVERGRPRHRRDRRSPCRRLPDRRPRAGDGPARSRCSPPTSANPCAW